MCSFKKELGFQSGAKVKETYTRLDNLKSLHNVSLSASKKCMFVAWCLFVLYIYEADTIQPLCSNLYYICLQAHSEMVICSKLVRKMRDR